MSAPVHITLTRMGLPGPGSGTVAKFAGLKVMHGQRLSLAFNNGPRRSHDWPQGCIGPLNPIEPTLSFPDPVMWSACACVLVAITKVTPRLSITSRSRST